jgi:hypothetical protein
MFVFGPYLYGTYTHKQATRQCSFPRKSDFRGCICIWDLPTVRSVCRSRGSPHVSGVRSLKSPSFSVMVEMHLFAVNIQKKRGHLQKLLASPQDEPRRCIIHPVPYLLPLWRSGPPKKTVSRVLSTSGNVSIGPAWCASGFVTSGEGKSSGRHPNSFGQWKTRQRALVWRESIQVMYWMAQTFWRSILSYSRCLAFRRVLGRRWVETMMQHTWIILNNLWKDKMDMGKRKECIFNIVYHLSVDTLYIIYPSTSAPMDMIRLPKRLMISLANGI